MAGHESDEADVEALRIARLEARATLDRQLSTLDDIDAKALSVFRLTVALVGVLLSALTLAAASDVTGAAALVNPFVGAGVALFILSAALAGLTYTAAGQRVGAAEELTEAADLSERAFLRRLVGSYTDWIRYNERTNARKALLVTLSILGTVAGALALGVGVVGAFTGGVLVAGFIAVGVVLALALLADIPGQLRRLADGARKPAEITEPSGSVAPQSVDPPMEGQRTFTGRVREE